MSSSDMQDKATQRMKRTPVALIYAISFRMRKISDGDLPLSAQFTVCSQHLFSAYEKPLLKDTAEVATIKKNREVLENSFQQQAGKTLQTRLDIISCSD